MTMLYYNIVCFILTQVFPINVYISIVTSEKHVSALRFTAHEALQEVVTVGMINRNNTT